MEVDMIVSYRFRNFYSYREEVEFSMKTPASKVKNRFEDNYVSSNSGYNINKTCVIVGENAGGKTNFVRSIGYLKRLLSSNDWIRAYIYTMNSNALEGAKSIKAIEDERLRQLFEIEVLINDQIYLYHLEIDPIGIVNEKLDVKKNKESQYKSILNYKRERIIATPRNDGNGKELSMVVNVSFEGEEKFNQAVIDKMSKEASSGLFVNKLAILAIEEAYTFVNWINNYLDAISPAINNSNEREISEEEDKDIVKDPRFLEILRMIDYSISKIEINDEDLYGKTIIVRKKKNGKVFKREIQNDSSGVGEYFALAIQIYKVVYKNKCIIADEVDRVLNPVLSDRIISFINGKKHTGQFIFTTHNVLHLDLKNYMKEQIYFATKDIETLESELYSLADFPEVRYEVTRIYDFYMKGILGGVANE